MALRFPCPHGFNFPATVGVIRRGPNDPLNWWDGVRWRRLFALDGTTFLLEAELDPGAQGRTAAPPGGLVVRRLEGSAPPPLVRRLISHIFGLDDPGPAFRRRVPPCLRPLIRGQLGTLLPGYPSLFEALVQTVLGQQLHVLVANRHREALVRAFGMRHEFSGQTYWTFPEPRRVMRARIGQVRRIGLSEVKAGAILAIARSLEAGRLLKDHLARPAVQCQEPAPARLSPARPAVLPDARPAVLSDARLAILSDARLARLPAAEAIAELSALPGVGRWTSEWVLLRALRRFEIVPAGDLAVRKAVSWALGARDVLTEQQVRDATAAWAPYGGLLAYRLVAAYRQTIG